MTKIQNAMAGDVVVRSKAAQQHFPGAHENLTMRPPLQDPPKDPVPLRRIEFFFRTYLLRFLIFVPL